MSGLFRMLRAITVFILDPRCLNCGEEVSWGRNVCGKPECNDYDAEIQAHQL
jgi:hypothetical protein